MPGVPNNSPLNLLSEYPAWAQAGEDDSAVVLSTRVRVARNLKGEVFPLRMDTEGRIRVMRETARVIAGLPESEEGVFFSLAALTPVEVAVLVERLSGAEPSCILATPKFIWVGTTASGFWRHNRTTGEWIQYTTADGLLDNHVQVIRRDGDDLLIGTPSGLTRFYWNRPGRAR